SLRTSRGKCVRQLRDDNPSRRRSNQHQFARWAEGCCDWADDRVLDRNRPNSQVAIGVVNLHQWLRRSGESKTRVEREGEVTSVLRMEVETRVRIRSIENTHQPQCRIQHV